MSLAVATAANYTWGGGTSSWTDTSASGWNGGPPASGDTALINSGSVFLTAETQENGVSITLGGSGVLNTAGASGYFDGYSSLSFLGGGTLTAVGGDATWGAGVLGSLSVGGSSASGSVINGSYFNVWDGATFNVADVTGDANPDLTVSAALAKLAFQSSASLTKTGAGTLTLGANNVLNNISTIVIAGGKISQTTGLSWSRLNNLTLQGGTVESVSTALSTFGCYWIPGTVTVSGSAPSYFTTVGSGVQFINLGDLGSSSGATTFNVADVTGSAAADLIVSTTLGNEPFGGSAGLVKTGAGTLELEANNSYTGNTTVSAGALRVNGTLHAASAVTVQSGGTLEGTGTIGGTVAVQAGGTLAAGSSIGTLIINGAATLSGTVAAEVANGPSADLISFVGGATLGGTLTVTANGTLTNGQTFNLFDGSLSGMFATLNLPGGPAHWNTSALYSSGEISFNNANPSAPNFTIGVIQGESVTFTFAGSKYPISDPDGDSVSVTAVGAASQGTTSKTTGSVTYTSTGSAGPDSFTYTVTDALGAVSIGTVTVQVLPAGSGANVLSLGGSVPTITVHALGIPGAVYSLQYTDSLSPVNWQDISGTATASALGAVTLTDPAAPMSMRYYRTKYVSGP